jgi:hypothetical protein
MDTRTEEAFDAISSFVGDLWCVFQSSKPTPLALYHRMITHINKEKSTQGMQESINGFIQFFKLYEKNILEDSLDAIPRGTNIYYGKSTKVFLEIQKYIHQSGKDVDTRSAIRKHLITISTILEPDTKKLEALDASNPFRIPENTKEGAFINDILKDAQNSMGDIDAENPTMAMASLFTNVVPRLVSGLQEGVGSGEMDMYKLMGVMQQAMASFMPPPPPPEDQQPQLQIEEVQGKEEE